MGTPERYTATAMNLNNLSYSVTWNTDNAQYHTAVVNGNTVNVANTVTVNVSYQWVKEVYLGGRWHTFDARNNMPRMARVLIARGRDAVDVPIATTFGIAHLVGFEVTSLEAPLPI